MHVDSYVLHIIYESACIYQSRKKKTSSYKLTSILLSCDQVDKNTYLLKILNALIIGNYFICVYRYIFFRTEARGYYHALDDRKINLSTGFSLSLLLNDFGK